MTISEFVTYLLIGYLVFIPVLLYTLSRTTNPQNPHQA